MKIFIYGFREEERSYVEACKERYQLDIGCSTQRPTIENANLANGYTCISMLSTPMEEACINALYENGVRYLSTRTIGYDHIDLLACQKIGMHVGNATYAPQSVADYTIMLLLMSLRKMKLILKSAEIQDYSFDRVVGQNLKGKCVGVIGTGAIGTTLLHHLRGFECNLLAYSRHEKESLASFVTYTDLTSLLQQSDIITLHIPLQEETYHMIDEKAFALMKQGVVLINTASGALIDNQALIHAIETGKVASAALDVVEGEKGIYYSNKKGDLLIQHEMAVLNSFPNVLMTPHMAFLTEDSYRDMIVHSIQSCILYMEHKDNPWQIQ